MALEVLDYNPVNIRSAMGNFTVRLTNGVIVGGLTLFKKDAAHWVSAPSRKVVSGGSTSYVPLFRFEDDQVNKQFLEAARVAVLQYCEAHKIDVSGTSQAMPEPLAPSYEERDAGLPF